MTADAKKINTEYSSSFAIQPKYVACMDKMNRYVIHLFPMLSPLLFCNVRYDSQYGFAFRRM